MQIDDIQCSSNHRRINTFKNTQSTDTVHANEVEYNAATIMKELAQKEKLSTDIAYVNRGESNAAATVKISALNAKLSTGIAHANQANPIQLQPLRNQYLSESYLLILSIHTE